MSKTFRPYEPDQISLMPASMRDWLPSDHLAYFISDIVDNLDLSAIMERYSGEDRGYPPYHPAMMVKSKLPRMKPAQKKQTEKKSVIPDLLSEYEPVLGII